MAAPFPRLNCLRSSSKYSVFSIPSLLGGNCSTTYNKLKSFCKRWNTSMVLARVLSKLPLLSMA